MSREEKPYLTRRELREARDREAAQHSVTPREQEHEPQPESEPTPVREESGENSAAESAAVQNETSETGRIRRVADAPLDAVPQRHERSSQTRARDRARLRQLKELEDKEEQLARKAAPLTRRQLRLQQGQTAPVTAAQPQIEDGAAPGEAQDTDVQEPKAQRPLTSARPDVSASAAAQAKPMRVARRDMSDFAAAVEAMSVEEAIAERDRFEAEAKDYFEELSAQPLGPDGEVDPKVLAEQIAMAERAAILNSRAARKQELARQANQAQASGGERPANDRGRASAGRQNPATAANLTGVVGEETVSIPGVGQPVINATTTQIQVTMPRASRAGVDPAPATVQVPRTPLPTTPAPTSPPQSQQHSETAASDVVTPESSADVTAGSRASILAKAKALADSQAEAAAPAGLKNDATAKPAQPSRKPAATGEGERVKAMDAYGLSPMASPEAGFAESLKARAVQWGILGAGLLALVVGITIALVSGSN